MEKIDHHAQELHEKGVVKLEGLIPAQEVEAARTMVLNLAEQHGVFSAGNWMTSPSRFGCPKPFRNALNGLNRSSDFPDLIGTQMIPVIERLIGHPVTPLSPGQQVLFTLPCQQDWYIPHDVWHVDIPRFGEPASPGLQAFTFLDDIEPRGGGTLVVAGSHHLLNHAGHLPSKLLKRRLQEEGFFRSLFSPERPAIAAPDKTKGSVGSTPLEVVELTGRIGDVYLMDLRVLHTSAPNCANKARLMLTCRFPRADIAEKMLH